MNIVSACDWEIEECSVDMEAINNHQSLDEPRHIHYAGDDRSSSSVLMLHRDRLNYNLNHEYKKSHHVTHSSTVGFKDASDACILSAIGLP